jgi:hypothetical protein
VLTPAPVAYRLHGRPERVSPHEFMFGMPDREHRARRKAHHALGDAAHDQMPERAATVCAHDDQIDIVVFRVFHDRRSWRAGRADDRDRRRPALVGVDQQVVKPSAVVFFNLGLQFRGRWRVQLAVAEAPPPSRRWRERRDGRRSVPPGRSSRPVRSNDVRRALGALLTAKMRTNSVPQQQFGAGAYYARGKGHTMWPIPSMRVDS